MRKKKTPIAVFSIDKAVNWIQVLKRVMITLAILISTLVVIIVLLHVFNDTEVPYGSVDIPGNVIDTVNSKADLEFKTDNEEENLPFEVEEMYGGSGKSILYRVLATYNSDFVLKYDMTVREDEEFKKLAEALKLKVELVGEDKDTLLYDGLMSDMPAPTLLLEADEKTTAEYLFRITAYLDSPLEEEYYGQRLIADMSWWIEGQDNISVANNEFTTIAPTEPPEDTEAPKLDFVKLEDGDNTAFDMKDIKDGDSESKYFAFELLSGEDVTLALSSDVVIDSKLSEVLKVKVELVGDNQSTTVYEGLLNELSAEHVVPKNEEGKTTLYYKVTVFAEGMDKTHYGMRLICHLSWSVKGTSEQLIVPSNRFEAYEELYTPILPPPVATSIALTAKDGFENIPFEEKDMVPGGSTEQYYCVSVTHDKKHTVSFSISLDETQKLSAVMRVKVEQLIPDAEDKQLYDGLMKDCGGLDVEVSATSATVTPIYYRVTVYTNGADVDNDYVGESLSADFSWQLQ